MNDLDFVDEEPRYERIHTRTDERRENRKAIAARLRKVRCAKHPFSRKQALSSIAAHRRFKGVTFLRTY